MNVSLVSTNYYMSGSYINFLDLHQYLLRDHMVTFYYTQIDKNGYWFPHMIKKTHRPYEFPNRMKLYGNVWIKDDIVITDFRGLVICKHWGIPFVCSKMIVIDSVELSYHLNNMLEATHWFDCEFSYATSIYEYLDIHECDEMIFLMPKVNTEKFEILYPDLSCKEFYKKINYDMLKYVEAKDNGKYCYRTDKPNLIFDALEKIDIYDNVDSDYADGLFNYHGFIYHRRKRLCFWEQFGRLIFEYIMLGKEVRFGCDPYSIRDGLHDYLKYYEIKFNEKRSITTQKDDLIQLMSQDYKDLI